MMIQGNSLKHWARALIFRNIWLVVALMVAGVALVTQRHVTWTSTAVVPAVGGSILYLHGESPSKIPDFMLYIEGDSLTLEALFKSLPGWQMKVVMTDIQPATCTAYNAIETLSPASWTESHGTIPFGNSQSNDSMLNVTSAGRGSDVSITCKLKTRPLHDSYATRALDFYKTLPGEFKEPGGSYYWTDLEHLAVSVTGNLDVAVSGPSGHGVIPSYFDERIVGSDALKARIRWDDKAASVTREWYIYVSAMLFGLAAGFFIEWARPIIDSLRRRFS